MTRPVCSANAIIRCKKCGQTFYGGEEMCEHISVTSTDIHTRDDDAAEIMRLQGELAEARGEIAHLKEVLEDEGIYTGSLSFTPEEHAKLKALVAAGVSLDSHSKEQK